MTLDLEQNLISTSNRVEEEKEYWLDKLSGKIKDDCFFL